MTTLLDEDDSIMEGHTVQPGDMEGVATELVALRARADHLIPRDAITVRSCAEFIEQCKLAGKRVEAKRRALVGPLNRQVEEINATYMPVRDAFGQLAQGVEAKVAMFLVEEGRRAEEEQRRINAEAEARRLELARQADDERRKSQEAAAAGDERAALKCEARAEKIAAKAATVVPTLVAPAVASTVDLGTSSLSVRAPKKTWVLPGWDKAKPLPVLDPHLKSLVGDLDTLPAGLRWLLRHCEVNPVSLNRAFSPHDPFPAPFAVAEMPGGSMLRLKA